MMFHRPSPFYTEDSQPKDPDISLRDLFDTSLLRQQIKLWVKEQLTTPYQKPFFPIVHHDEAKIEFKFDRPEAFEQWQITSDNELKCGYSKCELLMSKNKTAIFRGYLDQTVPRDGKTSYSGLCSMKSRRRLKSFFRPIEYEYWAKFTHMVLKVRGDGRNYAVICHTPGFLDVTWHDYYSYPLYTHGGPYWQYIKIPFSRFYKASHARILGDQWPLLVGRDVENVQAPIVSMAISLYDLNDGPFNLEIDWIGLYQNNTHREEFAYESYKPPNRF
uniref:NADH:ubiquinone oxidoreductase intermediate-associated protein 30 domain-containing protein n=1 Tax=Romanomermis culicivorax TaxID=13658 RepID=A0A915KWR7_ROMCU